MKKRIFGLFTAFCLVLALLPAAGLPAAAEAASGKSGAVSWTYSNGTLTFSGSGDMTPAEGESYTYGKYKDSVTAVVLNEGVTTVGEAAFYGFPKLTTVTAASTVTWVGTSAFNSCAKLSSVTLKGRGVHVDASAFARCTALTELPAGLGSLEMRAFFGCTGLKSLNLCEGIDRVSISTFAGCTGAKSLSLPASLQRLEFSAFDGCSGIETISVAAGSSFLSASDNMLVSTVYGGGKGLVLVGRNKTGTVTVPDGVTVIEGFAFAFCTGVTAVNMPKSVTVIYDSAESEDADELPAAVGCKNLRTVNYAGTQSEWAAVEVYDACFKNASVTCGKAAAATAFTDVAADAYCYEPVNWAVKNGITNGTTATTFSPNEPCTRGQIITFLWRASGSPAPSGSGSLTDVSADMYYAKAAQWAAEQGIIDSGAFRPNEPCSRFMAVEFLWKQAGRSTAAPTASFTDVPDGTEFTLAVNWAVAQNVTTGTSATEFSPFRGCTRGQIATFLWRDLAGK